MLFRSTGKKDKAGSSGVANGAQTAVMVKDADSSVSDQMQLDKVSEYKEMKKWNKNHKIVKADQQSSVEEVSSKEQQPKKRGRPAAR